jgi:hypothetical protein
METLISFKAKQIEGMIQQFGTSRDSLNHRQKT